MGCLDVFNLVFRPGAPLNVPSESNFLLESGYGNFLATFATGMPIRLNTAVTRIAWGGPGAWISGQNAATQALAVL
jgi:hypothetical protein